MGGYIRYFYIHECPNLACPLLYNKCRTREWGKDESESVFTAGDNLNAVRINSNRGLCGQNIRLRRKDLHRNFLTLINEKIIKAVNESHTKLDSV